MPYLLEDLVINRVDLVDEGANSAAFIELYKRKEKSTMEFSEILSKMKPEHAEVIQATIDSAKEELSKAKEELAAVTLERDDVIKERDDAKAELETANEDLKETKSELETLKEEADKAKSGAAFDETETLKSMPQAAREMFEKMKAQKDAAEEEIRKAKEEKETAEAVAKAKELKAIPVEQGKLVGIIKSASPELLDLLTTVNAAIEGTVLDEVGKSHTGGAVGSTEADAAWAKIEAKADEIAKRDSVTKAKAVSVAIKENPELYREYLKGGAN